jgi:hypothetical protein
MINVQYLLNKFYHKVLLRTNLTSQQRRGSGHLTIILSSTYFLFLPVLLTNDSILLVLLGTIWIPQIVTNFRFPQTELHFRYTFRFMLS